MQIKTNFLPGYVHFLTPLLSYQVRPEEIRFAEKSEFFTT
jgi:hypothetical protein